MPSAPLVIVDGVEYPVEDALRRRLLFDRSVVREAIDEMLLRAWAGRNGLRVSDQELQQSCDELRYQRGLESREAFQNWLDERHQTMESFQQALEYRLLRQKIRLAIDQAELRERYQTRRDDLETIALWTIRTDDEEMAQELASQVREENADFHALARQHSTDELSRPAGGWFGRMPVAAMGPEVEALVRQGRVGDVVGPVEGRGGWSVFLLGEIREVPFEDCKESLREELFADLLARLRRNARVEISLGAAAPPVARRER